MTKARFISVWILSIVALLMSAGCTIKTNEGQNEKDKKVDIKTPFGSLKVNEGVDAKETGIPLYAGATPYHKSDDKDGNSANVNISSGFFGLKVVVAEFTTPDPPSKVRSYYQDALKSFGKVVECTGSYETVNMKKGKEESDHPVDCSDVKGNNHDEIELKVGTESHQHVVGLKPDGSGTRFALVYVNAHGNESGS